MNRRSASYQINTFSSLLANKFVAYAEDPIEETETDDGNVTGDEPDVDDDLDSTTSPFADTYLLFTKPAYTPGSQFELPGGKFHNQFMVDTCKPN